jgi:acetyl esterase/lipase
MRLAIFCLAAVTLAAAALAEPAPAPLWPDKAPLQEGDAPYDIPTLTAYPLPDASAPTTAVVVCPGGGYGNLADDHEGTQIAEWLNKNGIAAFILRYRHAPAYQHPTPITDARRALRTVRAKAEEWNVAPDRIGIIGFSAGGHLTATASTQFEPGDPNAEDPIERVSSRPDFSILMYPVITMTDPYTHTGSRTNLLGKDASQEIIDKMSAEKNVTKDTPPAFIAITTDDAAVPVQNALLYYSALVDAGVEAELHVFAHGRHGLGLGADNVEFSAWPELCLRWLKQLGM